MSKTVNIVSIVGARPSFVKVAPLAWCFNKKKNIRHSIIHTGQHFDDEMSSSFFSTLRIPKPDFNLGIGSKANGAPTGEIMRELENILHSIDVDWIIVYGASNSTLAGALTAAKMGVKIAHVESGLRVGVRKHPEEINRMVAECVSDVLFVTAEPARDNLLNSCVPKDNIHLVGNLMIDSLIHSLPAIEKLHAWQNFNVQPGEYLVATMHQPYNVDDEKRLTYLINELMELSEKIPILFSLHPRTSMRLSKFNLMEKLLGSSGMHPIAPQDYLNFLSLVGSARGLITDSGGIADETTYLGIPCLTLRPSVERMVTVELGTNEQIALKQGELTKAVEKLLSGTWKKGQIPPLWDGKTAERIAEVILAN